MENEISERPWPCIVFFGISTCVIYSPKPVVAASLAVLLAVVHLPAFQVVEELPGPVVDAGERAQVRHQHPVVLLLRAGEVRQPAQPLQCMHTSFLPVTSL